MDNINNLIGGFGDVLTPMNLLFALLGVTVGTAVGVLPGIGPAMTVALLLPITYGLEPDPGPDPVRRHLLRRHVRRLDDLDPAQHPGRVLVGRHGHRGQQDGQGRTGRAGARHRRPSARSSPAPSARCGIVFLMPQVVKFAISLGAPEYFAIILLAFVGVTRRARRLPDPRLRGPARRPDDRRHRHRLRHRPAAPHRRRCPARGRHRRRRRRGRHLRRRRGAVGGGPPAAQGRPAVIPVGRPWMGREDWGRSWKPWLRGTALGFPFGAHARRRRRDPDLPVLHDRAQALQAPRGVRQGRHRGRRRSGGRQQRLCRRHPRADARPRPADQRHRGDHARGPAGLGHRARTAAHQKEPALVWALIASLFIGNTMLLVLNLPLAPAWAKLLQIPRPYLYAGILFFASHGCVCRERPAVRPVAAARAGAARASRCAGSACPSCRSSSASSSARWSSARGAGRCSSPGGDISGLVGGPVAWFCYALIVDRPRVAARQPRPWPRPRRWPRRARSRPAARPRPRRNATAGYSANSRR